MGSLDVSAALSVVMHARLRELQALGLVEDAVAAIDAQWMQLARSSLSAEGLSNVVTVVIYGMSAVTRLLQARSQVLMACLELDGAREALGPAEHAWWQERLEQVDARHIDWLRRRDRLRILERDLLVLKPWGINGDDQQLCLRETQATRQAVVELTAEHETFWTRLLEAWR